MFLTLDYSEHPAGRILKAGRLWRSVEYLSDEPWFCVAIEEREAVEMGLRSGLTLVWEVEELQALCALVGPAFAIKGVWLASPSRLNGSEGWRMESLQRIDRRTRDGRSCVVYTLSEGGEYCETDDCRAMGECDEVLFTAV